MKSSEREALLEKALQQNARDGLASQTVSVPAKGTTIGTRKPDAFYKEYITYGNSEFRRIRHYPT